MAPHILCSSDVMSVCKCRCVFVCWADGGDGPEGAVVTHRWLFDLLKGRPTPGEVLELKERGNNEWQTHSQTQRYSE